MMDPMGDGQMAALRERSASSSSQAFIPVTRPRPARLSRLGDALEEIERRGIFSNFGPVNAAFEAQILAGMFKNTGACVTVANATLGLMLAIKQAAGWRPRGRYALMPAFTFAATAQAALWCGLTPLFCDIDRETWAPDAASEEALIQQYGAEIAVIVPNATFGNCLDLARYDHLSERHGLPLVVDAAACLGSLNAQGDAFGQGSRHSLVFSMHATKCFATGEGGLIYSAERQKIAALRSMAGFGLNEARVACGPGLNAKLSEVAALLALTKLSEISGIVEHRWQLHQLYHGLLPMLTFQRMTGRRSALQFVSALVPRSYAGRVPEIIGELASKGIGASRYFVPHLADHPFFREHGVAGDLGVTEAISRRMISLPLSDVMTRDEVGHVCRILKQIFDKRPAGAAVLRNRAIAAGPVGSLR